MRRREFIGASALACAAASAAGRRWSFGVVPQIVPAELAAKWIPLIDLAAARSGLDLAFATANDIPAFESRLAGGVYDFAYMNPMHYAIYSEHPGYAALAREKGRRLRGIVVVGRDAPLHDLADLAAREVAFAAPGSFAATTVVRAEFARRQIAIRPRYVGSHESVYLNVAQGLIAAGGGIPRTYDAMEPAVRERLRILWTSPGYTPHAFAAHPRVPAPVVAALRAALVGLGADAAGRRVLAGADLRPLEAAHDAGWNDIRALRAATR
ncbi:MAG: phosphate/phosphite/phosphonate ABC transporter substrate-binding protein [Burkholderiales bacterium]|nr:phosphate/phosphite/phosphonate ABC transporter substrate-binding protein [Burkholderiales bacterium]